MKVKILLFFSTWLFATSIAPATHLIGGSISCSPISGSQYEAILTIYTDSSSVIGHGVDEPDATLIFGDGTYATVSRDAPGKIYIGNATYENRYTFIHSFPTGTFTLSYARENRIAGILNIDNSGNTPFYIETKLVNNPIIGTNSGIHFYEAPIVICELNKPFVFNITAVDEDGDSLTYKLITPKQASQVYVMGYQHPGSKPIPGHLFEIDLHTGEIIWDSPAIEGLYTIAVLIEEYRNNVFIGSVIRDYIIEVVAFPTERYLISETESAFNSNNQLELADGDNLTMKIVFSDSNGTIYDLKCFSELIDKASATFVVSDTGTNGKKGIFSFTASSALYRNNAYVIVFRGTTNKGGIRYASDLTFSLYIGSTIPVLSIHPSYSSTFKLFPNPASDHISIRSNEKSFDIELYDMEGNKLIQHVASLDSIDVSELPSGIYLVIIKNNREIIHREKILK